VSRRVIHRVHPAQRVWNLLTSTPLSTGTHGVSRARRAAASRSHAGSRNRVSGTPTWSRARRTWSVPPRFRFHGW